MEAMFRELATIWVLAVGVLLIGALLTGAGVVKGVQVVMAATEAEPVHICDAPEMWGMGWECIEYLESYWQAPGEAEGSLKGIGTVHVDGELRHSADGYNRPWYEAEYTYAAKYATPEGYVELTGCPTRQDGVEAMIVAQEFQRDQEYQISEGYA